MYLSNQPDLVVILEIINSVIPSQVKISDSNNDILNWFYTSYIENMSVFGIR